MKVICISKKCPGNHPFRLQAYNKIVIGKIYNVRGETKGKLSYFLKEIKNRELNFFIDHGLEEIGYRKENFVILDDFKKDSLLSNNKILEKI
jgi:hypothetical protein